MSFWFKLFGKSRRQARTEYDEARVQPTRADRPHYAPGTQIAYDPELVTRLVDEHRQLFRLFSRIGDHFKRGDMKQATRDLRRFRVDIQTHLLTEKVKLYVYLQHTLASDQMSFTLMNGLHREMDVIGKGLIAFLEKYDILDRDLALQESFFPDYAELENTLIQRIQREEAHLYPLYHIRTV